MSDIFSSSVFKKELELTCLRLELEREARYYEQGCQEEDGCGFYPHHVVWDVLPDNWWGEQPVRPFFVATYHDKTVPILLMSILNGRVVVWDVEGFTNQ